MSPSGKGLGLATAAVLGLVTATVVYSKYAAAERPQSTSADTTADVKQRSAMEENGAPAAPPAAPPLDIPPSAAGSKALIVCKEGAEEASLAEQWATQSRGGGATVSVCPPGYLDSHAKRNTGAYDSIVVEAWQGLAETALGEVVKLLKAGGKVNVAFTGDGDAAAAATAVKRALTFAGFLNVAPCSGDVRVLTGERAAWETGASAPVKLSFGGSKAAAETNNGSRNGSQNGSRNGGGGAKKAWKLALDDEDEDDVGGGGDDDLVDEDALLESSAPVKRATEADGGGGCATKRRACKGCSCGRAEMEMGDANGNGGAPVRVVSIGDVDDVDDALTSACGNCSKGDAFRCAGCPFLGKPAFEKGQEKTIMLSDLDAQQDD